MIENQEIDGVPIVLTTSRAEASEYDNNPFAAFICTFPKKFSGFYLRDHINNLESNSDGIEKEKVFQ